MIYDVDSFRGRAQIKLECGFFWPMNDLTV